MAFTDGGHRGSRIEGFPDACMPKPAAKTEPTEDPSEDLTDARASPDPSQRLSSLSHLSYEAAVVELEQLVASMEAGQMPLDRLLEGYKRGAELLSYCRSRLKAVEEQVQVLEDGQLQSLGAGKG